VHYRNGREVRNGDTVVSLGYDGGKIVAVGILHNATTGNDYCNGSIAPISTGVAVASVCDCLHMDDVAEMLKEKGLDKRPSGKENSRDDNLRLRGRACRSGIPPQCPVARLGNSPRGASAGRGVGVLVVKRPGRQGDDAV